MLERGRAAHNYRKKTPFLLFCCSKVLTQSLHRFPDSFLVILVFDVLLSKREIILNPGHSVVLSIKWKIKYLEHSLCNSKGPANVLITVTIVIFAFLAIIIIVSGP